ncbi:hypothetical protein SAMN05444483_11265 [Salegentibacter echinorum]|uniref:UDP-glycosyltransferase n=1 Tax=Salegentibacter echinorum TaxID=1073325 RepID=A0A1M5JW72_SALEC|nr:UDP-glycosyltransferase [Salegentibacter echinorum]SHG44794.1 hypothetical protein SAMN05444483_11265 [Salegentibacter echinorum]
MNKKIFILVPDGVGLRNFGYTQFEKLKIEYEAELIYWNNTVFPIKDRLGFQELKINETETHKLTPLYSRARKRVELNNWANKFNDEVYHTYKFPFNTKGLKNKAKTAFIKSLIKFYNTEEGGFKIGEKIKKLERKSSKYISCKKQLEKHKPDFVFCTSQRSTQAIAPILAARDLKIPTASFIYSWDNVPKAMLVVDTDYYFVWSDLMKEQLLTYYPYIPESRVFVTGTPQFEPHFDKNLMLPKQDFFREYGLDENIKYICFSGDDTTTSPLDQYYLEDLALAVKALNNEGSNLRIIFRKAPVDTTNRYDEVLKKYKELIVSIEPAWAKMGGNWNEIFPLKEDFSLLNIICEHSELVVNICSSMVFDFALHNKACIYLDYEQPQLKKGIRDIGQNYNYVHFRSMPSRNAVGWVKSKQELKFRLKELLQEPQPMVKEAQTWFKMVAGEDAEKASQRIWNCLNEITA